MEKDAKNPSVKGKDYLLLVASLYFLVTSLLVFLGVTPAGKEVFATTLAVLGLLTLAFWLNSYLGPKETM